MDRSAPPARDVYPKFLTPAESLYWQCLWCWHGIRDSFQWIWLVSIIYHDADIRINLAKSLGLNTAALVSILTIESLFSPLVEEQSKWIHRHLGSLYNLLWLSPVLATSFYFNSTWCQHIAQRTYALQHGNRANLQQPKSYSGMVTSIASSAYRMLFLGTFLVVSLALDIVPLVGPFMSFLLLCWINSYYCFEFVWIARGMSLSRRVRHLEERWAYYLTFGAPSAFLCTSTPGIASAALFALIFPAYIMMAMHSRPVPLDAYNPGGHTSGDGLEAPIHPSPFVPIRIPIFALVIWLNDQVVQFLAVGSVKRPSTGHRRSHSDAVDNIEDGAPSSRYGPRGATQRINLGARRRKDD